MSFRPLLTSEQGVAHFIRDNHDGTQSILSRQDTDPILDRNKAMATENDGYSPSKEMRRVASIPYALAVKWLNEEGWWMFDPGAASKLAEKLNSSEYAYLRTAPGQVGVSNGRIR